MSSSTPPRFASQAPLRPVRLGPPDARIEHRPDGTIHIRARQPLPPYHTKLSEPLERWAREDLAAWTSPAFRALIERQLKR